MPRNRSGPPYTVTVSRELRHNTPSVEAQKAEGVKRVINVRSDYCCPSPQRVVRRIVADQVGVSLGVLSCATRCSSAALNTGVV